MHHCGELAVALSNGFNTLTDQGILPLLHLRGTTVSKVASESQRAVTQILQTFDPHAFLPVLINLDKKLVDGTTLQGRKWILIHLRTILIWHRARFQNQATEVTTINWIETTIRRGFTDRNSGIWLIVAKCFWTYQQTWPQKGMKFWELQNQHIRSMRDGEKYSSYTSYKPEMALPTTAVPDIAVSSPRKESSPTLRGDALGWDRTFPLRFNPVG
ncbi:hypothetical protein FRC03_007072 [Tulasnella sp. 419]|nr:hypothetical protein FRC03_007072 [Tulasnella sp. 419]